MRCSTSLRPISEPMARIQGAVSAFLESETPEQRRARYERCEQWEREQAEAKASGRRSASGIPARYTCADAAKVPELQACDMTASMLLLGPQGRGKTYAACAVLNRRASDCVVRFATFDGILKELQACFGGRGSLDHAVSKYRNCMCLAIDDFGKEKPTDYAIGQFFELLEWRIANGKQTIVTSNYSMTELVERMGRCGERHTVAAIMSRLACTDTGRGGFQRIEFGAADRRLA